MPTRSAAPPKKPRPPKVTAVSAPEPPAPDPIEPIGEVEEEVDRAIAVIVDMKEPFSLDEIEQIENLCGVPVSRWFDGITLEGALRRALLFVAASRGGDKVTLADAGRVKMHTPTPESRG